MSRVDNMVGSWAGAMGQCQFMPTTFLTYAVDFNGDGRRDIWTDRRTCSGRSPITSRGSVGAAMKAGARGRRAGQFRRAAWRGSTAAARSPNGPSSGCVRRRRRAFTGGEPAGSLVLPDGAGGTALLVYDNFRAIKKWNNSNYFAAAVGYIADSIDSG